jgi:hypothetical protein
MSTNIDLSLAGVPRTKNGLIMPAGVVFYYLHREDGSAGGCVCFGAIVGKKPVRFCRGVSFCSRQDQFSRATGRELAYRRFLLAVSRKENSEPIRRLRVGGMGGLKQWYMSEYKSCFDVDTLTPVEEKFRDVEGKFFPKAGKPVPAKPIRLTVMDRHELKAAGSPQGARPRFCDGKQSHLQWRSWQKLLRVGLAVIEGDREAECLLLRRALPAAKAKRKRTCHAS